MKSLNFKIQSSGTLLASGPGSVTVTHSEPYAVEFLIGDSDSVAPMKQAKHIFPTGENLTINLEDGSHLWAFYERGEAFAAVSAENPASGDIRLFNVLVSGLVTNPTHGQAAQIGQELTGSILGLEGEETIVHGWSVSGSIVVGETDSTYTPVADDDTSSVQYSPTINGDTIESDSYIVRYAPPIAGSLTAVSEYQGNGSVVVNLSPGFTGSDLSYSVDVAWATVNGSNLTINDELRTDTVEIIATNSGGEASLTLSVDITEEPDVGVTPADYSVSTVAEWDAVLGNSTAILDGKIMEITAPITEETNIANHDFPTGFTIRSATPADTLSYFTAQGTVNNLTFSAHLKPEAWDSSRVSVFRLLTGNFDNWLIDGVIAEGGYGASLVPLQANTSYPETVRPEDEVTATTTSQTYPLSWLDAGKNAGRVYCFNNGTEDAYIAFGDSNVVATTSDQLLPGNANYGAHERIDNIGAADATHFAVITASGTTDLNIRPEIGLQSYLTNGFTSGGSSVATNWIVQNCDVSSFSNGWLIPVDGVYVQWKNKYHLNYQDNIKSINSDQETWLLLNDLGNCLAVTGIAQDLNGHANDPHGDLLQGTDDGSHAIGPVISAGNVTLPAINGQAQSVFMSDNDHNPSYEALYCIGDTFLGGVGNGIVVGERGGGEFPADDLFVYGVTLINHDDLSERSNIRVELSTTGFVSNTIMGGTESNNQCLLIDTIEMDAFTGPETTYFSNYANLATASTRAEVLAAVDRSGQVEGSAQNQNVIDPNAATWDQVVQWDQLPAGLAFEPVSEQIASSVYEWPLRKVTNRGTGIVISGAGASSVEFQTYLADGITVDTAWTSSNVTVNHGQYVQMRATVPAADGQVDTISFTSNGISQSTTLASRQVLTNPFVVNGAHWIDPVQAGSGIEIVEVEVKMARGATAWASNGYLAGQVSSLALRTTNLGFFATAENVGGTIVANTGTVILFPDEGVVTTVNAVYDYVNDRVVMSQDGVAVHTENMTETSGNTIQKSRSFMFNTISNGNSRMQDDLKVEYFRIYKTIEGVRTLHKEISVAEQGSIAGINSDPWTNGTVIAG